MRVCYVCRGYPGLGKVVGALAVHEMLAREVGPAYRPLFATYYQGAELLRSLGLPVLDLGERGGLPEANEFCTAFGRPAQRLMTALEDHRAELVINDGEPYLVELPGELLGISSIVLAHPLDLHNPQNTGLAVRLFRHFYARADLVLAHGLEAPPDDALALGGRAGRAHATATLVRDRILHAADSDVDRVATGSVLCVLGGGSKNSTPAFRESSRRLAEIFLHACADANVREAKLLCADREIYDEIASARAVAPHVVVEAEPVDNTDDLIRADVVVARAGRNLLSELVALGKRGVVVQATGARFRTSGRRKAAAAAQALNPNLLLAEIDLDGRSVRNALVAALAADAVPVPWQPGNAAVLEVLRQFLRSSAHALTTGP